MSLSSPKIRKFLTLYSLSPQNVSLKIFLFFPKKKPALKNFLIFSPKKIFSYILGNGTFLSFEKWNFLTLRIKKFRRELSKLEKEETFPLYNVFYVLHQFCFFSIF